MTNSTLLKAMSQSASKLTAFVVVCIVVLLAVRGFTSAKIQQAEQETLIATFNEVLPAKLYNNQPLQDVTQITDATLLQQLGSKQPVMVYRARHNNQPAGVIFQTIAPNGYSGNIYLLIAVLPNGQISGVRALKHLETPGLGDKIELAKHDWILGFNHKALNAQNPSTWAVKKDGGEFDQFTGATITPRAVVGAVKNALLVVNQLGEKLYE